MSAATQSPRRSRYQGNGPHATRHTQHGLATPLQATRHEHPREQARKKGATRARRERAQDRLARQAIQERRILGLLGRGAGVTQILAEISAPQDTARESLAQASHLRRVLEAIARDSAPASGIQIKPRKLMRALAFLDGRLAQLTSETSRRGRPRPGHDNGRAGACRHPAPAAGALAAHGYST